MGLDMYAYAAAKQGQYDEFNENKQGITEPKEIAYWRKHPNLHGWMQNLWVEKGRPGVVAANDRGYSNADTFNGIELELTWEDLDKLERDILDGTVASLNTTGFFFGFASDDHYREHDLKFIKEARADLFIGLKVFYNSSW